MVQEDRDRLLRSLCVPGDEEEQVEAYQRVSRWGRAPYRMEYPSIQALASVPLPPIPLGGPSSRVTGPYIGTIGYRDIIEWTGITYISAWEERGLPFQAH